MAKGKKLHIPADQGMRNDVISRSKAATEIPYIKVLLADKEKESAAWLDRKAALCKVTRLPIRSDIIEAINEQLIVEFYSR